MRQPACGRGFVYHNESAGSAVVGLDVEGGHGSVGRVVLDDGGGSP